MKKSLHTFSSKVAFFLAVVLGVLLTALHLVGFIEQQDSLDMRNAHILLNLVLNVVFSYVLFDFNFFIAKSELKVARRYIFAILGTIVITTSYTFLSKGLRLWIYNDVVIARPVNLNLMKYIVMALTVLLITFLLFLLTRRDQMELEKKQLEEENMRIRYDAIESKLDPHFLFNSLNTLNGLIGFDDDKAHQYVHQLAATYRYIIQNRKLSTLREEMEFAESYIYLMQIRYGQNLIIQRHISPHVADCYVVSISLQLLIENALKHNVVSNRHPLTIVIEDTPQGFLRVSNPVCQKQESSQGAGLGLANLSQRYEILFRKEVRVNCENDIFSVELPLISKDEYQKAIEKLNLTHE